MLKNLELFLKHLTKSCHYNSRFERPIPQRGRPNPRPILTPVLHNQPRRLRRALRVPPILMRVPRPKHRRHRLTPTPAHPVPCPCLSPTGTTRHPCLPDTTPTHRNLPPPDNNRLPVDTLRLPVDTLHRVTLPNSRTRGTRLRVTRHTRRSPIPRKDSGHSNNRHNSLPRNSEQIMHFQNRHVTEEQKNTQILI